MNPHRNYQRARDDHDRARRIADLGAVVILVVLALYLMICAWTYPNRLRDPREHVSIGTALVCDRTRCVER